MLFVQARTLTKIWVSPEDPGYRFPDQISDIEYVVREVKNVSQLSYTKQLRDYVAIAQREGYTFELIVRKDTKLSIPLQNAINRGEIILRRELL